jgi:hypothetical protein
LKPKSLREAKAIAIERELVFRQVANSSIVRGTREFIGKTAEIILCFESGT